MPKFEDNVAFVKRIMSSGSPLRQAFVLEAIAKYAKACAQAPATAFDNDWLNGRAWKEVAVQLDHEISARYDGWRSNPAMPIPPATASFQLAHPHVGVGLCKVCGHYGEDCTGDLDPNDQPDELDEMVDLDGMGNPLDGGPPEPGNPDETPAVIYGRRLRR